MAALMRRSAAHAFAFVTTIAIVLLAGARAKAQDPPPPIPRIVVDLRGSFPKFPRTSELAASRGLDLAELPGVGLGIDAGIHLKVLKWKAVTFGLGGLLTLGRSHSSGFNEENQPIRRAVTEAGNGDIVVIAGKGHELTQTIGGVEREFSDVAVARAALAERGGEPAGEIVP